MFGLVNCNAWTLARHSTDPRLFFVRTVVKNWVWPIITFFGVTGNILAIIVLTKRRMIMSSTNNYLTALAFVDIGYLTLTLVLNTSQHPCFSGTTTGAILLTICRPIADFFSNTSVWITVTFTVERWVAITYPLQSRTWCTVRRARRIIASVMCAAMICTLPSAFEMKLVRIKEITNSTNLNETRLITSRIQARPTALGNSLLYHQIYFNFVTFAIIWIPLLLLIVFNTILIHYVHQSKQTKSQISEGCNLRRHNQGNHGEQRKTTIMLIAVVIVFTVCQIPQAISLTVSSFFPVLSQTPKVLIYNNFANCLVALNASINFLLYCCFSERFRSTFSANFICLTKYCMPYISSNWEWNPENSKTPISVDNMSKFNYTQSNTSLHRQGLNVHTPHVNHMLNSAYLKKSASNYSQNYLLPSSPNQRSLSLNQIKFESTEDEKLTSKHALVKPKDEPFSSTLTQQSARSSISTNHYTPLRRSIPSSDEFPIQNKTTSRPVSSSMHIVDRSIHEKCLPERSKPMPNIGYESLNKSLLSPHSEQSLDDCNVEVVWIKRRLSNSTTENQVYSRRPLLWEQIIDATV